MVINEKENHDENINGLGKMTNASESSGGFSSSVSYGYDQRGLVTGITYPNEKIASYSRDCLGRIVSVTYDGRTIVGYGYQGDKIAYKQMPDADIEYDATIDTLGRITAETYSDISDSQNLIANTYDYTSYSNRLDTYNTVDYSFDTLGKLTAEDSTSYTSDILGNPTNAADDGFTYTTDNENRITEVEDAVGTLGQYDYDLLGRRRSKTVGDTKTNFVYDISGNVISEYETDITDPNSTAWTRDYVYGAAGEPVYMQLPRTTAMNQASSDFWDFMSGFADAWLCYPNCTASQLVYDCNTPDDPNALEDQVNWNDWPCNISQYNIANAFDENGRYLLTDLRQSVTAIAEIESIKEITYNAWGAPSYTGDIEGLSVLWNGYYYDYETGNYYLRNRYYSPLERKFLTEDPHGINPDGTWRNSFGPWKQYMDGYGLQVYAGSNPVNRFDSWGLWKYAKPAFKRKKEARTFVEASGYWEMMHNIKALAKMVRLDEEQFDKWGERAVKEVNGIKKCGAFVPNTVLAYWAGEMGGLGKTYVGWYTGISSLRHIGYHVVTEDGWTGTEFTQYLENNTDEKSLLGIYFWGHGVEGSGLITKGFDEDDDAPEFLTYYREWDLSYKLGIGLLYACYSKEAESHFSDNARGYLFDGTLAPWPGPSYPPSVREVMGASKIIIGKPHPFPPNPPSIGIIPRSF